MAVVEEILPGTGVAVSLSMAKKHLNIEDSFTEDDEIIQVYIQAAVGYVEVRTGRPLYQVRKFYMSFFEDIVITAFSEASVTSVTYLSNDPEVTDPVTLASSGYSLSKINNQTFNIAFQGVLPGVVTGNDRAITITVNAECPHLLRSAVLLKIGDFYARREDRATAAGSKAVDDLCFPYRVNL